jgi:hypothetical protein
MATFSQIMKEEIGDLSGLRGVRKKKNPYDEDPRYILFANAKLK